MENEKIIKQQNITNLLSYISPPKGLRNKFNEANFVSKFVLRAHFQSSETGCYISLSESDFILQLYHPEDSQYDSHRLLFLRNELPGLWLYLLHLIF